MKVENLHCKFNTRNTTLGEKFFCLKKAITKKHIFTIQAVRINRKKVIDSATECVVRGFKL